MGCTHTDEKIRAVHSKHQLHAQLSWSPENETIKWSGIERGSHGGVIEVVVNEKNLWAKERRVVPDQKASLRKSSWMEAGGHGRDIHSFYIFCIFFIFIHTLFNSVNFVWSMIPILHMKKLRL